MDATTHNSQSESTQPSSYEFEGRQVDIRPNAQADASGLLTDAVFIDGRPLGVRTKVGGYCSAINFYQTFATLQATANAAVVALAGRPVPLLRSDREGKLPEGLPDLDDPNLEVRRRKDLLRMTPAERNRFVEAVLTLKENSDFYDDMVKVHMDTMTEEGHMWGAHRNVLLPWHRLYLYHFESLLRAQKGFEDVTLPYWNWTNPPRKHVLPFTVDFMGGGGVPFGEIDIRYKVMEGPFAYDRGKWSIVPDGIGGVEYLQRREENSFFDTIIVELNELHRVLDIDRYAAPDDQGFNYQLNQRLHDVVHNEVGGTMGSTGSPSDPIFWLHHCMLDKVWADWQERYPDAPQYENTPGYHPDFDPDQTPLEPWLIDIDRRVTINQLIGYKRLYVYEPS